MRTLGMPGHRTTRALLALVAALALLLVGAGPAAAHDEVVATTPAAQASVPEPPAAVEVELSSPPQVLGTVVQVTGPDGSVVSEGDPEVLDTTVRQPLADGLPAGGYAVEWRVTSGDGHAITGSSTFTVTAAAPPSSSASATPAPATVAPAGAGPDAEAPGEVDSASAIRGYSPSLGLVVGAALLVLLLAGLVLRRLRRKA